MRPQPARLNLRITALTGALLASTPISVPCQGTLPMAPDKPAQYSRQSADAVVTATVNPLDFSESYTSPFLRSIVETHGFQLNSSFSVSSGYDTALDDLPGMAGSLILGEASVGLLVRKRRSNIFVTHDAKITRSFIAGIGLQQYQQTSAAVKHEVSRRTNWSAMLENAFGSDSAYSIGSLSGTRLNSGVIDPTSNATGLPIGNTLTAHGSFNLEHSTSQTRTFDFDAGAYYHHYFDLGTSSFEQHADVGVRETLSARTTVGLKGTAVRTSFDQTQCTTAAVNVFTSLRIEQNLRFEISGGPAFSTDSCSGRYQYDALLSQGASYGMVAYVGSSRRRSDGLEPGSTWESVYFGGLAVGQPRRIQFRSDAGYAKYDLLQPTATASQSGYFFSGKVDHRVSDLSAVSLNGRFFSRDTTNVRFTRAVILATYTWSREQRPNHLQKIGQRYGNR